MGNRTIFLLLVIVLAVLAAAPLSRVRFVTVDDSLAALDVRRGADLWDHAWDEAEIWGRIQIAPFLLASYVPHLPGTGWGFQAIKIASTLGAALMFCVFAARAAGTWRIGGLCLVLFLCATQNTWLHNLLNAYPFVFDLAFALALGAMVATMAYVRSGRALWLVLGGGAFLGSIWIYETFLAFVALAAALATWTRVEDAATNLRRRRLLAGLVPLGVALLYLVVYKVYAWQTGGSYAGYEDGELFSRLPVDVFVRLTRRRPSALARGGLPPRPAHRSRPAARGRGSWRHARRSPRRTHACRVARQGGACRRSDRPLCRRRPVLASAIAGSGSGRCSLSPFSPRPCRIRSSPRSRSTSSSTSSTTSSRIPRAVIPSSASTCSSRSASTWRPGRSTATSVSSARWLPWRDCLWAAFA